MHMSQIDNRGAAAMRHSLSMDHSWQIHLWDLTTLKAVLRSFCVGDRMYRTGVAPKATCTRPNLDEQLQQWI